MDFVPGGELSRRIRDGDVSAESELIRQFEPGLRVLLRRRTGGDHGLLQDLVQETLLVVIQRLRGAGIDDPQQTRCLRGPNRKKSRHRVTAEGRATENRCRQ